MSSGAELLAMVKANCHATQLVHVKLAEDVSTIMLKGHCQWFL